MNNQHPLDQMVEMNGELVLPRNLPLTLQLDYLINNHFKFFCSKENKLWRLENLYHIMDKNGRKVLFSLNKAQKHFVDTYLLVNNPFKRIIILKSRQLGFTTLIALWFLDEIIWHPNTEALQIAHTVQDAKEIFNRKIRYAINNLPDVVKNILTIDQARATRVQFMYPEKDGQSISAVTVAGSGRSGTYHLLHISEFAKLAKQYESRAEEVIKGTLPSVPIDGTVFIESTAEGMSGLFYEMFMSSWKRRDIITPAMSKAEFYPVFYNWTWDEEEIRKASADGIIPVESMEVGEIDWKVYQEENELTPEQLTYYYTKWVQMNRDVHRLHQEICTTPIEAFIGSGSNFFSLKRISDCIFDVENNPPHYERYSFLNNELILDNNGDLYIKTQPEYGKKYIIGADVAQGLEHGDFSTACVVGLDKQIKAFYRGHIEPDDFEKLLRVLGLKYKTAELRVESNFDGNWVNSNLVMHNYPNVYMKVSFDDITKTVSKSFGWRTDFSTRKNILENARVHLLRSQIDFRLLLDEMLTFVRDRRGKPQASSGKHDDCIMAWAIALTGVGDKKDVVEAKKQTTWSNFVYN